jgi:hypothetical protein
MKQISLVCFILLLTGRAGGETKIDVSGSLSWETMELNAAVSLNLNAAGLRLPTGRSQGEELIGLEYPNLLRPYIFSIPIDSSATIADLIQRGEFSPQNAGAIAHSARRVPPVLSADMSLLSAAYTIDLTRVSAQLIRHNQAREIWRPLIPAPAADYTGIIIIAGEELPIHGRFSSALVQPCLFPKIWDSDMNLIYEKNMLDPQNKTKTTMVHYVPEDRVFRPTPSGLDPDLISLVGSNPLRIIAREVFGIRPTDPVIDRDDALLILSSEANLRLIREGRVVIALHKSVLKSPLRAE